MPTVLITGANRGLGLEFATQYLANQWRVIATCRAPLAATALNALQGSIEVHPLDVTDFAQVEGLGATLAKTPIDVLINNAGIYGPRDLTYEAMDYLEWPHVMRTNVAAPLKLSAVLLGNVARSTQKKIVAISSKMGSMTDNTSGGSYIYRSSKAALNATMKSFSIDIRGSGVTVGLLHPGWVRTDMGGPSALIDASESVEGMRQVIADLKPERTGHFFDYEGNEVPW
jgi:NAD(P)-dependent dehydrogenase (short-subunit alcohol dehydrogenase family)